MPAATKRLNQSGGTGTSAIRPLKQQQQQSPTNEADFNANSMSKCLKPEKKT
jgi:hypothetical protein